MHIFGPFNIWNYVSHKLIYKFSVQWQIIIILAVDFYTCPPIYDIIRIENTFGKVIYTTTSYKYILPRLLACVSIQYMLLTPKFIQKLLISAIFLLYSMWFNPLPLSIEMYNLNIYKATKKFYQYYVVSMLHIQHVVGYRTTKLSIFFLFNLVGCVFEIQQKKPSWVYLNSVTFVFKDSGSFFLLDISYLLYFKSIMSKIIFSSFF